MNIDWTVILSVFAAVGLVITAINNWVKSKKTTTITKSDWNRSREQLKELDRITDKHEIWITEIKSNYDMSMAHTNKTLDSIERSIGLINSRLNSRCPYHEKLEGDVWRNRESIITFKGKQNES